MGKPKNRKKTTSEKKTEKDIYNPEEMPPRFSFRLLIKHSDFGFESLEQKHKIALLNTMHQLSQYKWSELRMIPRHGKGYEQIEREALNFKLPADVPDHSKIIAFRFCGEAPMLGYRSSWGTFYIIALDTKFKAYSH